MNSKKGFTLIELLAVIVILAIIALIAVPIILNIINDSKESSDERSIELYGSAVEQAVAKTQLKSSEKPLGKYTSTDGKTLTNGSKTIKVDYKGNKVVCDVTIYEKGTIYLDKCKVGDKEVEYTYGEKESISFAEDDWKTIVANVKAGNTSKYKVGDTKEITLTGEVAGTYTIRIANTSTPEECNQEEYSQTACGFVIEFEDIITTHNMNSSSDENPYGTNAGGWEASEMRTYVNNTIYNSLPTELRENIIPTTVVSSHGSSDTSNFTTTDKLYLLSTKEVWGKEGTSNVINNDTAENETRQLDYYNSIGVTTSNYSGAIKQYKGSNTEWCLRSAGSNFADSFYGVRYDGKWGNYTARSTNGVAVAFRIG